MRSVIKFMVESDQKLVSKSEVETEPESEPGLILSDSANLDDTVYKNKVPSLRDSKVIAQRDIYALTFDLGLDSINLILKLELDIMNIYVHAKNKVRSSRCSKFIAQRMI